MNWSSPFTWFIGIVLIGAGLAWWIWRDLIDEIIRQITSHAKGNTRRYVRGFVYVAVAGLSDLKEVFTNLSKDVADIMPWWSWIVLFTTPLLGMLVTLGAYLDTSAHNKNDPPPAPQP